ncbi:xaa-Pro aminopeptidase 3-like [Dermatophagoides pteronyssinus]|uniref:xaa-Pro aminopeptidase 3-like n=1 Tax=Dermatophagoides pteronyssinus TaxID=6956 RepID=UPI003F66B7B7
MAQLQRYYCHRFLNLFRQKSFHHQQQQQQRSSLLQCHNFNLVNNYDIIMKQSISTAINNGILLSSNDTLNHYHDNISRSVVMTEQHTNDQMIISPLNDMAYESFISHQEIRNRQQNLILLACQHLKKIQPSSTLKKLSPLILISTPPPQYQGNTMIPVNECKQNSDFTYLTGLHSGTSDQLTSNCVLAIFLENPDCIDSYRSIIFSSNRTKSEKQWHGPELSVQYEQWLKQICDDCQPLTELINFLNKQIKSYRRDMFISRKTLEHRPELVTHLKFYLKSITTSSFDNDVEKWSTSLGQTIQSVNIRDISMLIDQLRVIKSSQEVKAMKRVGRIGAIALNNTIEWSKRLFSTINSSNDKSSFTFIESHIDGKFNFESKLLGARCQSFPSVCASGSRATIIHYGRNDHIITPNDDNCWILTDVGCEDVDGYCCDISRTWPIDINRNSNNDDRFQLQSQLYEALIGIQHELINSIVIGHTSLNDLNELMLKIMTRILPEFKLFDESVSNEDVRNIVKRLCPHHVSHYLGLDIHDTPSISRSLPLIPGMCFTIEPGLYFPTQGLPIKQEFRGIGIRIEDDIIIEPDTNSIIQLTNDCPKLLL